MTSAICTVFEDHYHYGVAVLINSLYNTGFRGSFFAGYRGNLPQWAKSATKNADLDWPGTKSFIAAEGLEVHFLPVITDYHLTHYKPFFMLALFEGPAKEIDMLAYFDPDIVNLCKWEFYEKWTTYGVAMVHEIVSNDMPVTHPTRIEWYHLIKKENRMPKREIHSYINAGFCGISRQHIEFLIVWKRILEVAIKEYKMDAAIMIAFDKTKAFYAIDQDSFNIAALCCESPISEMGPEAMDFVESGWTMSHATGRPKPWKNRFTVSALKGNPPSRPHKNYWKNVKGPISVHQSWYISLIKTDIFFASLIGRFYRRN